MASEVLSVPEEYLRRDVVAVIREGLIAYPVSEEVKEHLEEWCSEEEAYLEGMV